MTKTFKINVFIGRDMFENIFYINITTRSTDVKEKEVLLQNNRLFRVLFNNIITDVLSDCANFSGC